MSLPRALIGLDIKACRLDPPAQHNEDGIKVVGGGCGRRGGARIVPSGKCTGIVGLRDKFNYRSNDYFLTSSMHIKRFIYNYFVTELECSILLPSYISCLHLM